MKTEETKVLRKNGKILEEIEIEILISDILKEIGTPMHIKGYIYLKSAIKIVLKDFSKINSVTKIIYPKVAEEYSTTVSKVERAMRHIIELAFQRGNVDMLHNIFGYSYSNERGKATNSEFIAGVAEYLRLHAHIEN